MTSDGNYNGFGIRYYGDIKEIYIGWWKDSNMIGSGVVLNGDWTVKKEKFSKTKSDQVYKEFKIENVMNLTY